MVEIAIFLGAEPSLAEEDMHEVLDVEIKLANLSTLGNFRL